MNFLANQITFPSLLRHRTTPRLHPCAPAQPSGSKPKLQKKPRPRPSIHPQAWSIAISATILQNRLQALLPPAFLARIPPGHDIAYSAIPLIPSLAPALRAQVRRCEAELVLTDATRLLP